MDKSGRRFVVHFQLIERPRKTTEKTNQKKTQNYNLDLSSQRGQAKDLADQAQFVSNHQHQERYLCLSVRTSLVLSEGKSEGRRGGALVTQ
jgi:hypothetical protein